MNIQELKDIDKLFVFKHDEFAGVLERTSTGSRFMYDGDYRAEHEKEAESFQLAYQMPLHEESYRTDGVNLPPFFAGLLPEGLRLKALVQSLKTSQDDLFSLLVACGGDSVGDISVSIESTAPPQSTRTAGLQTIEEVSFFEVFEHSIFSQDMRQRRLDSNIAGVQPKVSANIISMPVSLAGKKKQYILKISTPAFSQIVENENFFMKMARDVGIEVPEVNIIRDKDNTPGLLVERFDRRYSAINSSFEKIHQEDACQFLAKYPADKYRLQTKHIAEAMQQFCTAPIIEISRLIRLLAFSYLVANGDMHAKNISIATDPKTGRTALTPSYDLLSTLPYGDREMALEFEGRKNKLRRKHYIEFGDRFGVRGNVIQEMLDELVGKTKTWIKRIEEIGFAEKKTVWLQKVMTERLKVI